MLKKTVYDFMKFCISKIVFLQFWKTCRILNISPKHLIQKNEQFMSNVNIFRSRKKIITWKEKITLKIFRNFANDKRHKTCASLIYKLKQFVNIVRSVFVIFISTIKSTVREISNKIFYKFNSFFSVSTVIVDFIFEF